MKHVHDFEPFHHPELTAEAKALGIKAAELRRCRGCQKEMTFIWLKEGWFPLFKDKESDEQEILLA